MMDTATIAVIISGLVAMGALVVTPVITFANEWLKWKRENKRAKNDRFLQVTTALIDSLSRLQVEHVDYIKEIRKIHSQMLKHYYIWELMVQSNLKRKEREALLELRKLVTQDPTKGFQGTAAAIVERVLTLSAIYIAR